MNNALPCRKIISLLMLASAGTAVLISSARADTILVDTGTPNGAHYTDVVPLQGLAIRFDLSAAETITRINGYFEDYAFDVGQGFKNEPGAGTINVGIIQGSSPSGASLYSGSFAISDTQTPAWLGVSGVNTMLTAGTYWITFTTNDAYADMLGNAPIHLSSQFSDGGNNWSTASNPSFLGLEVYGNPVPQGPPESMPDTGSTAILFAFGIASVLAFSGRRKLAA